MVCFIALPAIVVSCGLAASGDDFGFYTFRGCPDRWNGPVSESDEWSEEGSSKETVEKEQGSETEGREAEEREGEGKVAHAWTGRQNPNVFCL